MVKNSTLFYICDNLSEENELYTFQEITEEKKEEEEMDAFFDMLEFTPPDRVLEEISKKAL